MAPNKIILLACGSFNPPTNMHLRMFGVWNDGILNTCVYYGHPWTLLELNLSEWLLMSKAYVVYDCVCRAVLELARDNLNRLGQFLVIGGIISPVHDAYEKKELIPSTHRCEMVKLALKSSDWIQISDWECSQESWSRTRRVLQYHQNMLNAVLNDQNNSPNNNQRNDIENGYDCSSWITNDIRNTQGPVQIKLLCGADLLESFATPGLWADEDIETIIGQHGIVVITRQGTNPQQFIYESDLLTKYQHNITIVTEWITNDVSSTKVRRALRRQESVKYLIEDTVIEFIKKHGLYGTSKQSDFKYNSNVNEQLPIPIKGYLLTPSPSDINMMSSSSSFVDIYLNLRPLVNKNITEPDCPETEQSNSQVFQSTAEIKFSSTETKASKTFKPKQIPNADGISPTILEEQKKVGIYENEKVENEVIEVPEEKENKKQTVEDASQSWTFLTRKFSEKHSKCEKKIIKTESEKGDKQINNLVLRRSQSDAIVSKKGGNGEAASVKIQFTKDGIKVISDKESIV